jgi:hypothetical protein
MDGTEQKAHASKDIYLENNLFSSKKDQHSITLLLIISPSGRILFISICYYGSVIDYSLVVRTRPLWQPQLTGREGGLGDGGFRGLREKGINIFTPVHDHQQDIYKEFSRIRIPVENKIRVLKIFECCRAQIREPILNNPRMLQMHSKKWKFVGTLDVAKINNYRDL